MSELTAENAAQALAAAMAEDANDAPSIPVQQEAPSEEGQVESNQEAEKPSGLFYDVDPNSLTPEMRRMFDGMQKSFTENNQRLAEERKQLEALGGVEQAQQAIEFVQSLQDPQNLVQLHSELSEYLQNAGYTKAQADEAATSAIQQEQPEPDFGFEDPQVAQLKQELDSLTQWRQQFEAEQEQARIEAAIERTELALRQDRGYNDEDVSRLYQLAYAHGGDLTAAADAYDAWKQSFVGEYVNRKAEAPTSIQGVSNTHGQMPESFGNDMDAAHRYAKQLVKAMEAAGELRD